MPRLHHLTVLLCWLPLAGTLNNKTKKKVSPLFLKGQIVLSGRRNRHLLGVQVKCFSNQYLVPLEH